jgi:hypothetical protein
MNIFKWFRKPAPVESFLSEKQKDYVKEFENIKPGNPVKKSILEAENWQQRTTLAQHVQNHMQTTQGVTIQNPALTGTTGYPWTVPLGGSGSAGGSGLGGMVTQPVQVIDYNIPSNPHGYNENSLNLDKKVIIAVKNKNEVVNVSGYTDYQFGDIILCMDTMKMYQYTKLYGQVDWIEVIIRPNLTVELQTANIKVEIKEDRKEIFDAFEENLKPFEKPKNDSILTKAKDWLGTPMESTQYAFK